MNIEEMDDWDILVYLREERNWLVLYEFSRNDIENMSFVLPFTDEQWKEFCEFSDFDYCEVKQEFIKTMYEEWMKDYLSQSHPDW